MDLQYLFLIFRARFAWIVLYGVIFAAAGLGAGLLLHRRAATATLLVTSPMVEVDASRRGAPPAGPESSAVDVLSSPRVVQRVISTLGLTLDHPQARSWGRMEDTETSVRDWMVTRLLKDVRFTAAADSSIVTVTGYSRDPEFAKALANAFAQAYQQVSREVQADQARARAAQLEQGLPRIEDELRSAREGMAAFRKAHPGFNPDDRNTATGGTVAALSTQLAQVQAELASPASRATDDLPDPALQPLQLEARRARARWQEVSTKYGSGHPAYADAASEMERAEEALQAAAASAWRANSRRAGSLRTAIRLQQKEAVGQAALHEEYSTFQRAVSAAETSANRMRTSLRQARLERDAALGTAAVFSSAMLQPAGATDPWRRALPLGAVVGLLLGSIFALLAEEWSPRVRRSRSSIAALGARLLARVPAATAQRRMRSALLQADEPDGQRLEPSKDVSTDGHTLREHALGRIVAPGPLVGPPATQRLPQVRRRPAARVTGEHARSGDGPLPSASLVVDLNPTHPVAEAVRELRTNVLLAWRQSGERRPVCLQSLQHGDGRTFVACNVAIAFAQARLRTVLVDLDLRTSGLHTLFGLQPGAGVAGLLSGQQVTPHTVDSRGFLDVLPAGPRVPNPQELVSGTALPDLLRDLNRQYEAVVLDGPAWSCGADAQLLACAGADVVLVAHNDHTPLRQLQEMRDRLEQLQVRILGVVINEH